MFTLRIPFAYNMSRTYNSKLIVSKGVKNSSKKTQSHTDAQTNRTVETVGFGGLFFYYRVLFSEPEPAFQN